MRQLNVRSPEDILAATPLVLGFFPEDSVVMLTFDGERPFHARLDLPGPAPDPGDLIRYLAGVGERLLGPARRMRVRAVLFVLYSADGGLARQVVDLLGAECEDEGIRVLEALRVHDGRWFALASPGPAEGTPFDLSSHRFMAEAVVEGVVTLRSRAELAARVARDPGGTAAVAAAMPRSRLLSGPRLREVLEVHASEGTLPDSHQAAAILRSLAGPSTRDFAWYGLSRAGAQAQLGLWTDLVRRAPDVVLADAAAVLAMLTWIVGNGAAAWCAVDRGRSVAPGHSLLRLVSDLLEAGVPPISEGEPGFPAAG